jgi:hypothetical protein
MLQSSIIKILSCTLLGIFLFADCSSAQSKSQSDDSQKRFDAIDKNSDKQLSKTEFKSYVEEKLPGFNQFEKLVTQLDSDKNGSLSIEEFRKRRSITQKLLNQQASNKSQPVEFAETFNKRYLTRKPVIGDGLGNLKAFDELGNEFDFDNLQGKFTVINFGCLT